MPRPSYHIARRLSCPPFPQATIFSTGELSEESVIRKFRTTAADGKSYLTGYYNLDAIIAVGYRVNSRQATQFRQWSTSVLRDYIIKGFAACKNSRNIPASEIGMIVVPMSRMRLKSSSR